MTGFNFFPYLICFAIGFIIGSHFFVEKIYNLCRGSRVVQYVKEHNVYTKVFYKKNLVNEWKDNLLNTSAEQIKLRKSEAKKLLNETKNKF